MRYFVVKVSVSAKQARLTIPKEIALDMGFINKDGERGKNTYAIISGGLGKIVVTPAKIEEEVCEVLQENPPEGLIKQERIEEEKKRLKDDDS